MQIQGPTLVYVYDALCGWCYGFAPVIERLYEEQKDRLTFEVVSGGMITGARIGPIGEVAPYIKQAYKVVEDRCGVTFGEAFLQNVLEEGSTVFTSVPAGIALEVFKSFDHPDVVGFAGALQRAVYYDGIAPGNYVAYGTYAVPFGIDAAAFNARMYEPRYAEAAERAFRTASEIGVTGFPTVFFYDGGGWHLLARGYVPYAELAAKLEAAQVGAPND